MNKSCASLATLMTIIAASNDNILDWHNQYADEKSKPRPKLVNPHNLQKFVIDDNIIYALNYKNAVRKYKHSKLNK